MRFAYDVPAGQPGGATVTWAVVDTLGQTVGSVGVAAPGRRPRDGALAGADFVRRPALPRDVPPARDSHGRGRQRRRGVRAVRQRPRGAGQAVHAPAQGRQARGAHVRRRLGLRLARHHEGAHQAARQRHVLLHRGERGAVPDGRPGGFGSGDDHRQPLLRPPGLPTDQLRGRHRAAARQRAAVVEGLRGAAGAVLPPALRRLQRHDPQGGRPRRLPLRRQLGRRHRRLDRACRRR